MLAETWCLGIPSLGLCAYNPASPTMSQFSIGEGCSAIALLFVLYELIDDNKKIRIFMRESFAHFTHFLFLIALLSIFLAAALPFIPGEAIPVIGYPIFWEFTAGVILVTAILVFLAMIGLPIRVTKRNASKYLDLTYKVIASNKEALLKPLTVEIAHHIKPIIQMAKEKNDIETVKIANTVLILWSDKDFCKIIVNHALFTVYEAIYCIKNEENYENAPGQAFIQQLINLSMTSKYSLVTRENEYCGLGPFKNMTEEIFDNYEFVKSMYRPLQFGLKIYQEDGETTIRYVKNYFMCLNTALRACIESMTYKTASNPFLSSFDEISHISSFMASKLSKIDENIAYESSPYLVLSEISSGFHKMLDVIYSYEIESNFNEEGYNYLDDDCIYGVIAWGLCGFFKSLATCLKHDDLIRGLATTLWLDIEENDEILRRVIFHLKKTVNTNLIKGLGGRMIVRLLINLEGLSEPIDNPEDQPRIILYNYLMESLKTHYKRIFDSDPILANRLLPEKVTYDSQEQLLIITDFLGQNSTLKISNISDH